MNHSKKKTLARVKMVSGCGKQKAARLMNIKKKKKTMNRIRVEDPKEKRRARMGSKCGQGVIETGLTDSSELDVKNILVKG